MTAPPVVSVLIVSYQTRALVLDCLESLFASSPDLPLEVIVFDNASTDGTVEAVEAAHAEVVVIRSAENLGFARAVNVAAAQASGAYLLLLNPDTIVHPGAVAALLRCAQENPRAGLIGGRTVTSTGETEVSSCWGRPTLWSTLCFATGASSAFPRSPWLNPEALPQWDRDSLRTVGVVTGCLLLVHRDVWSELGGFDPRFFMYGEDTDLSIRAWRMGYRPMITPEAEVVHTLGASSNPLDRRVMVMRGKATLARKHAPRGLRKVVVGLLLAGTAVRAAGTGLAAGRSGVPARAAAGEWVAAWRRRAEWRAGYPTYSDTSIGRSTTTLRSVTDHTN